MQMHTEAFQRWFGRSAVVNSEGKPLVVYHGSLDEVSEFRTVGNYGQGEQFPLDGAFFAENEDAAREFGEHKGGEWLTSVYLSLQNPSRAVMSDEMDAPNAWRNPISEQEVITKARAAGNDGVIFTNDKTGERYFVAFRPEQIKSAIGNRGTFDPNDRDISR